MDLPRARWLASPEGGRALADVPSSLAAMPLTARLDHLRRSFPPDEASALSEQVDLRTRAQARFGSLPLSLYTSPGLEMLTHPLVAARRAARLAASGLPVADLTCGIGGDLAALATACHQVVGMDNDPVTATLARHNVPAAAVVVGDVAVAPIVVERMAVVLDPARRSGFSRRFNPASFSPPWDTALAVAAIARVAAIKGPPGLPGDAVPDTAEIECIQFGRAMRETALYLGADAQPGLRRAVVLPGNASLDSAAPQACPDPAPIGAIVYDPASAVTLAGLVRHLAIQLDARLVDPHLGYLTAGQLVQTPLADAFEVIDIVPFAVARVRRRLVELALRPHEIRRRAFPVEPDELRRLLGPLDGAPCTLLCCTVADKRLVLIARPRWSFSAANV